MEVVDPEDDLFTSPKIVFATDSRGGGGIEYGGESSGSRDSPDGEGVPDGETAVSLPYISVEESGGPILDAGFGIESCWSTRGGIISGVSISFICCCVIHLMVGTLQ